MIRVKIISLDIFFCSKRLAENVFNEALPRIKKNKLNQF